MLKEYKEINKSEVGDHLRQLRKSKDISQEALASDIHIKPSTYAAYENGQHIITIEVINKLINYYHTSYDYIINGSAPMKSINNDKFCKMPVDVQNSINNMIHTLINTYPPQE